jgi:N-acetyl-alpha-D-muramate 1-phosphate uridylyltransferase
MIDTAMILAAGRGERMRPLTDSTPKPLLPVGGMSMLERSIDHLKAHGVVKIVVNAHHFAEQIVDRMKGRAQVIVEDRLLDTGGGVKNALPLLGNGPFLVLNGDGLWRDGPQEPTLERMEGRWDAERMDALLLLHPLHKVIGREPKDRGDYFIEPRGRLRYRGQAPLSPYVFAGVSICQPRLFRDSPDGAFSLLQLWHRAEAEGRLHGMVHDGDWFHVGTPQALARAERMLAMSVTG